MRLRNIPRADGVIKSHPMVVQDTQESRGNWKNIFGNDRPVYLEIGMGKGRFLMNMAKEHPLEMCIRDSSGTSAMISPPWSSSPGFTVRWVCHFFSPSRESTLTPRVIKAPPVSEIFSRGRSIPSKILFRIPGARVTETAFPEATTSSPG